MPGWPAVGRTDDQQLVAALRRADMAAPASLYDSYAERLNDYAHSLLGDRDAAAEAVHDALVTAQGCADRLREPGRLRAWLYALTRFRCGGGARGARVPGPELGPDVHDDPGERELAALVYETLAELSTQEREVLELSLRHGLSTGEAGAVLGLSSRQAAARLGRARDHLENAAGAVVLAKVGRAHCPDLSAMVDSWEGPLTTMLRRRLSAHIGRCEVCVERRDRHVSAGRLLDLVPVALPPLSLRRRMIETCLNPDLRDTRDAIVAEGDHFDRAGFPTAVERRTGTRRWPSRRGGEGRRNRDRRDEATGMGRSGGHDGHGGRDGQGGPGRRGERGAHGEWRDRPVPAVSAVEGGAGHPARASGDEERYPQVNGPRAPQYVMAAPANAEPRHATPPAGVESRHGTTAPAQGTHGTTAPAQGTHGTTAPARGTHGTADGGAPRTAGTGTPRTADGRIPRATGGGAGRGADGGAGRETAVLPAQRRRRRGHKGPLALAAVCVLAATGAVAVVGGRELVGGERGDVQAAPRPDAALITLEPGPDPSPSSPLPADEEADPETGTEPDPGAGTEPAPTPTAARTRSPRPAPTAARPATTGRPTADRPRATRRATPPPATGRLTVSCPSDIGEGAGQIRLAASGAPVSWSATTSGGLNVHPRSGRLKAGARGVIWVTAADPTESGSGRVAFRSAGGNSSCAIWWESPGPEASDPPEDPPPQPTPTPSTTPGTEEETG
ncbi:hypothetical protein GCM10010517_37560 [Streptosporangium fragile]|uniref:RNA polymerase sigma-70 region 2 domain-containing protein n=1 Tax=Streptosporangium fragile TaxID=46186 RepID=A0ABP6IET9_9ACTN